MRNFGKLLILFALSFPVFGEGFPEYRWYKVKEPAKERMWLRVSRSEFSILCGRHSFASACTSVFTEPCIMYSTKSAIEAMWIKDFNGMTLYDHEMKHCDGWMHNDIVKDYPKFFGVNK